MIRPQLTADGRAVEIPTAAIVAAVLDAVATAYAEDADVFGQVLAEHAAAVQHREHLTFDDSSYAREIAAADADETREAIEAELDADVSAPVRLTPSDAQHLADRLITLAAMAADITRTAAQETAA